MGENKTKRTPLNLSEAARQVRREYYRQYRKENAVRRRETEKRYWERKAAQLKENS
jgi:hypothetical protein